MSGKRQATYDLNHDNWDRDEEPEERGTFRTASEDELKNRVIKKAKRKIVSDTGNDTADSGSGTKSVFSGFSGFGKPAAGLASSPFSFLSKIPAVAGATSCIVSSSTTTTSVAPTFSFVSGSETSTTANTESSKTPFSSGSSTVTAGPVGTKTSSTTASKSPGFTEYHKKLSGLNQAVCEWIKTHVEKNPVCILSPIFKDYEKYLIEIENEKRNFESVATNSEPTEKGKKPSPSTDMSSFKFSNSNNVISTKSSEASSTTSEAAIKANGFSFGLKKAENAPPVKTSTTQGFSFALNPSASLSTTSTSITTNSSSFSFSNVSNSSNQSTNPVKAFSFKPAGTPFSFGNIKPPDVSAATTSVEDPNEEADEEPPKNEFKQVVEDDAVYSKKCKVFVKKDGNFVDKGVGTLYLKPVESSGKTQMLVRADTNLGNILVNLILNSAIPTERKGKNNVMMVCLPTPDVEKPTLMLLRVKTSEEAEELLENINNHKK